MHDRDLWAVKSILPLGGKNVEVGGSLGHPCGEVGTHPPAKAPPTVYISEPGCITLIVGNNHGGTGPVRIIVSANTVKRINSFWGAICSQRNKHHLLRRKAVTTIELPFDDPDTITLLMAIAHARFDLVPPQLSFVQLLHLAEACDRYDMRYLVKPFLKNWIKPHRRMLFDAGREQWLYIAYQFGLEKDYLILSEYLAKFCRVDVNGDLYVARRYAITGLFPPGTLPCIKGWREDSILEMLDHTMKIGLHPPPCRAAAPEIARAECVRANRLAIVNHLTSVGYLPNGSNEMNRPGVKDRVVLVLDSALEVFKNLINIAPPEHTIQGVHMGCNSAILLAEDIVHVWQALRAPVWPGTVEELRVNKRKTFTKKPLEHVRSNSSVYA